MGRKKIQITRIMDERNRQVSLPKLFFTHHYLTLIQENSVWTDKLLQSYLQTHLPHATLQFQHCGS
uniref:MADS-box domain-containing protein n=1 Tax=Astyanax mexicanus TaxID=7994 RepID=A0A3B1JNE1_ASTMX